MRDYELSIPHSELKMLAVATDASFLQVLQLQKIVRTDAPFYLANSVHRRSRRPTDFSRESSW